MEEGYFESENSYSESDNSDDDEEEEHDSESEEMDMGNIEHSTFFKRTLRSEWGFEECCYEENCDKSFGTSNGNETFLIYHIYEHNDLESFEECECPLYERCRHRKVEAGVFCSVRCAKKFKKAECSTCFFCEQNCWKSYMSDFEGRSMCRFCKIEKQTKDTTICDEIREGEKREHEDDNLKEGSESKKIRVF